MAGAANFIIDQMNVQDSDNHAWYIGNNTNFPAVWVKAGGYAATSATGTVMNSDWINIGAASSTNGTIKAAFIGVASNEDFLAIWQSTAMSQNGTNGYVFTTTGYNGPMQYSTNATDAAQFGTNRFAGFLFGRNGTFGAALTNIIALFWPASVQLNPFRKACEFECADWELVIANLSLAIETPFLNYQ